MEDKKIENFGIRLKFAQGLLKVRYSGAFCITFNSVTEHFRLKIGEMVAPNIFEIRI